MASGDTSSSARSPTGLLRHRPQPQQALAHEDRGRAQPAV